MNSFVAGSVIWLVSRFSILSHAACSDSGSPYSVFSLPHHSFTPTFDPIQSLKYSVIAFATAASPYFMSPPDSALVMCCCAWCLCIMLFITSFSIFLSGSPNLSFLTFRFFLICNALSYLAFLLRCASITPVTRVHVSDSSCHSFFSAIFHISLYLSGGITSSFPIFLFALDITLSALSVPSIASASSCILMLLSACRFP